MSNLVDHAERELAVLGYTKDSKDKMDYDIYLSTVNIVKCFATVGHSGSSASVHAQIIERLLRFEPLGPITDNPDEWMHIEEAMAGRPDCWQNRRDHRMFSNDAGKTYYSVEEFRYGWRAKFFGRVSKTYTSKKVS